MKKLIIVFILLLSGIGFAQKSVLTEKQKDSIKVMIGDSTSVLRGLIGTGGGTVDTATVEAIASGIARDTATTLRGEIDLRLFEDFTQYDADTPESTDLFTFQDVNSGVPKRITYGNLVTGLSIPSISGLASETYVNQ